MLVFKHRYAKRTQIGWEADPSGGDVRDVLVVTAGIETDLTQPGFDQAKLTELELAAAQFVAQSSNTFSTAIILAESD